MDPNKSEQIDETFFDDLDQVTREEPENKSQDTEKTAEGGDNPNLPVDYARAVEEAADLILKRFQDIKTVEGESSEEEPGPSGGAKEKASDADKTAQKKRSSRYGIGIKEGGNVTKPSEWKNVSDANWADPVNYKGPMPDAEHANNAASRFNQDATSGQYSSKELSIIRGRIKRRQKALGVESAQSDGGKKLSQKDRAEKTGVGIKRPMDSIKDFAAAELDCPIDAIGDPAKWGDWTNLRFAITEEGGREKALEEFMAFIRENADEYSVDELKEILHALTDEHIEPEEPIPARKAGELTTKDIQEAWDEALDDARDRGLRSAIAEVVYAWQSCWSGNYWEGDADALAPDEFNQLTDLMAEAVKETYATLAQSDESGESMAEAAASLQFAIATKEPEPAPPTPTPTEPQSSEEEDEDDARTKSIRAELSRVKAEAEKSVEAVQAELERVKTAAIEQKDQLERDLRETQEAARKARESARTKVPDPVADPSRRVAVRRQNGRVRVKGVNGLPTHIEREVVEPK